MEKTKLTLYLLFAFITISCHSKKESDNTTSVDTQEPKEEVPAIHYDDKYMGFLKAIESDNLPLTRELLDMDYLDKPIPASFGSRWPQQSPIGLALEKQHKDIVIFLQKARTDCYFYDYEGGHPELIQPLIVAVGTGNQELVKMMLKWSPVDVTTIFKEPYQSFGHSLNALQLATAMKNEALVELLRSNGAVLFEDPIIEKEEGEYYHDEGRYYSYYKEQEEEQEAEFYRTKEFLNDVFFKRGPSYATIDTASLNTSRLIEMMCNPESDYTLDMVKELAGMGADLSIAIPVDSDIHPYGRFVHLMDYAVADGRADIVEFLLQKKAKQLVAMELASVRGNVEMIRLLTKHSIPIVPDRWTIVNPVALAIRFKQWDALNYLLEQKPDFEDDRVTQLYCVREAPTTLLKQLKEAGLNINYYDTFAIAFYYKRWDVIYMMLHEGYILETTESKKIIIELAEQHYWKRLKGLIARGVDPNMASDGHKERESPLSIAIREKDLDLVAFLLDHGADPNRTYPLQYGQTTAPLMIAILKTHDLPMVQLLIEKGADLYTNTNEYSILRSARWSDTNPLYQFLLNTIETIECPEDSRPEKIPAFHQAVREWDLEKVTELLNEGADPNEITERMNTPLHTVSYYGKMCYDDDFGIVSFKHDMRRTTGLEEANSIIKLLIKKGADINAQNETGKTPLFLAVEYEMPDSIIETFVRAGADVTITDQFNRNPLIPAAARNEPELIDLLISKGADVKMISTPGQVTPLHIAAQFGRIESAKCLVKHGINTQVRNRSGLTPAETAYANEKWGLYNYLTVCVGDSLPYEDANTCIKNGRYLPVVESARSQDMETVEKLIAFGADINKQDPNRQETALMLAADKGNLELVRKLVDNYGANINLVNDNGKNALGYAVDYSYTFNADLVHYLVEKGSDGLSDALVLLFSRGVYHKKDQFIPILKTLVENGANVNGKNSKGESVLSLAKKQVKENEKENHYREAIKYLEANGANE